MTKERSHDLSVVIVNYNVVNFLEQCLNSVLAASQNLRIEIFVVDNNSVDGSVALVRDKFPSVQVIANTENVGFSKANNQAIMQSKSRYVLLLNPDTVVEQDTFDKCIAYMDAHPNVGGLGVRMLDGKGMTGLEAYRAYGRDSAEVFKRVGGRQIWAGRPDVVLTGPTDERWDLAFIAHYPTAGAFLEMVTDPHYRVVVAHRTAGVLDSRLIRMEPLEPGEGFGE